jgi:sulfite exporter TauE/SafE
MGISLLPVFLVGLAGSIHCVGMCGGIVGAFSMAPPRPAAPRFPVAVVSHAAPRAFNSALRVAAYNAGRIGSYSVAGAIAGGFAGGVATLAGALAVQGAAFVGANLMLVALGLYLMDAWRGVARIEQLGQGLWSRLRGLTGAMLPVDTPLKMFALGGVWGWLPCGMVYSVLVTAMLSGSAAGGAAVMAAFGLGTLPMLAALGLAGARLRQSMQRPVMRRAAGLLVLGFGILGLARAATGLPMGWLDVLCVSGTLP